MSLSKPKVFKMPKVSKIQSALVDALNTENVEYHPRSLASVCNKVNQSFRIIATGDLIPKPHMTNQMVLSMTIEDIDTQKEYNIFMGRKYLRKIESMLEDLGLNTEDYTNLNGLVLTVTKVLKYKGYTYPELIWSVENQTIAKKRKLSDMRKKLALMSGSATVREPEKEHTPPASDDDDIL